jgi:Uma2 family endonuclease
MLRCREDSPRTTAPTAMPTTMTATADTRRWTYAEYCRIPPDGKRHEIIDGRHYVNPAPGPSHQSAAGRIYFELLRLVEKAGKGRVYISPIDLHLGGGTVVQPDVVLLTERNAAIVGPQKLTGVADLVVEVLSPSKRAYDAATNRERYERAGVREFWVVDADERTVRQFVLRGGRYGAGRVCRETVTLRVVRGVTVDLREVWT